MPRTKKRPPIKDDRKTVGCELCGNTTQSPLKWRRYVICHFCQGFSNALDRAEQQGLITIHSPDVARASKLVRNKVREPVHKNKKRKKKVRG